MFRGVKFVGDFAALLDVPKKSMNVVTPKSIPCKTHSTPLMVSWYRLDHQRGNKNLGPEFAEWNHDFGYFPGQGAIHISTTVEAHILHQMRLFSDKTMHRIKKKVRGKKKQSDIACIHGISSRGIVR